MDENLNWKTQIHFTFSKLRNVSFMIFKSSNILKDNGLKILYYSLFYPSFDCCNTYYSNVIKGLVVLQKKVLIRTISHNDSNIHSNNLFYSLNISQISDIIKYKNCTLSYKAFNNNLYYKQFLSS